MSRRPDSSPIRSRSGSDGEIETHELEEDLSYHDVDVEQHEGLLSTGTDAKPAYIKRKAKRPSPGIWPVCISTALGLLSIPPLVFLIKLYFHSRPDYETNYFRRPSSDYILSSNWDFTAPPQVREYNWTIQEVVGNPDGVFRPLLTVNGKFPGDLIRCNEGDTIVVNVVNQATNATAIHWHGIFQNGSNWMDGTPGITQCPIAPGRTLRYEFTVKGQAGTYFYHGHQAGQSMDGLVGPVIVHGRDELQGKRVPYASERIILLQDWYHDVSSAPLREKLSPGSESIPPPDGALMNGANKVDCALHAGRRCDSSTASFAEMNLQRDGNHRLRLLNVGAGAWFEVTIDRHSGFPMIEVDGTEIEPATEDNILIAPGQRYSIVITPNASADVDTFWFRARMLKHCFADIVSPDQGANEVKGVIRYTSDTSQEKSKDIPLPNTEKDKTDPTIECKDMNTQQYFPVPARSAPLSADQSWYLRVNLEIGDWRLQRGVLNTSSYRPNLKHPMLHRVLDGLAAGNGSFKQEGVNSQAFDIATELVISNKGPEVIDVILQNFDEGNHPFHLHGHVMYILGAGHGYFPGYASLGLKPEGKGLSDPANSVVLDNPLRRDVATLEGFGWLLVRFVADNPGVWLFHCHMIWHGESGMAMQFLSQPDVMERWIVPQQNRALCDAKLDELEKGAAPNDSIWYGHPES